MKKGGNNVFQTISNPEFEVLFNALDRDNGLEYRLIFTPIAQKAMVDLLLNETYKDYFCFLKRGESNLVLPLKVSTDMFDVGPEYFYNIDNRLSRQKFVNYNLRYFKSVYYFFAPLFTIPLYKQHQDINYIYGEQRTNSTSLEQETLANVLPRDYLLGSLINTKVIVNTSNAMKINDITDKVHLTIKGYQRIPRTEEVPIVAGNGQTYFVTVNWFEYKPVTITRDMYVYTSDEDRDLLSNVPQDPNLIRDKVFKRRNFTFGVSKILSEGIDKNYKLDYEISDGINRDYDFSYDKDRSSDYYNDIILSDYNSEYFGLDK